MIPDPPRRLRSAALLQQADEPLFVLNARRQIVFANAAWEAWAGVKLAEVRGRACRARHAPSDGNEPAAILAILAPPLEALACEPSRVRRRSPRGSRGWCQIDFFPWRHHGRLHAILGRVVPDSEVQGSVPALPDKLLQLRDRTREVYTLDLLESEVPEIRRVATQAKLASQLAVPVLLRGPSGCGKEWLARTIHLASARREEFFACLDAALAPSGIIVELTLGRPSQRQLGAVLIKRAGALSGDVQRQIARAIEDGTFLPRLYVSESGASGDLPITPEFRAAVGVFTIELPGLAACLTDGPRWIPRMLSRIGVRVSKPGLHLSPDAERLLGLHTWPGNFREWLDVIRAAATRAPEDRIDVESLSFYLRQESPPPEPKLELDQSLEMVERRLITLALRVSRSNKSKAAELLGIWRARLLRRMETLAIEDRESDREEADHA